ncbi:hypothetical protein EDB19DRAFT_1990923 [Suillus lakei]|nr:hypothetical protein EDB19DRAFT_1990923 [Suillus lakei]
MSSLVLVWTTSFCAVDAISAYASSSNFNLFEDNVNCIALFNLVAQIGGYGSCHPPELYLKARGQHQPTMSGGIVIKTNAKQKYASNAIGSFVMKKLVECKGGKVQEYEVRNDIESVRFDGWTNVVEA